jgi:Flp pilus assembly protein TadB
LAAILLAPREIGLAQGDHVLAYAVLAVVLAALLFAYLWKRRRLRRERS